MAPAVLVERTKGSGPKKSTAGKSHKFSRGRPSSFVGTGEVGDSEGFGSFAPVVDSEGSCAPTRKRVSWNVDTPDGFNVPSLAISLSRISASERKALEARLRAELEQTQALEKRISSWAATSKSGVASSVQRHGKKHDTQLKHGISGRFEPRKTSQPPASVSSSDMMLMKQCEQVLSRTMAHQYGWVFNVPVDVKKLNIPDYPTVIKHPMDLGTVKRKLASGAYSSPWAFVADVRLTFTNAMTYNPPGNNVHAMADQISKWFEQRWKPIEKKLSSANTDIKREKEPVNMLSDSRKRKAPPVDQIDAVPKQVKRTMTAEEKLSLEKCLESLLADLPEHIIDFLKRHGDNANQIDEDEIEIDIGSLSDDTLFELRKLLDAHIQEKQNRQQPKALHCEMKVINERRPNNPLPHPCKVNEPVDEDIDIGDNDPPLPIYPPVEIEKEIVPRSSKYSSSSSSSSSSGSSSDSDSDSSGSESEGRVHNLTKIVNGSSAPEATVDQEKSEILNPLDINRTNGSDKVKHNARLSEADGHLEGDNAPSEREASPGKLHRAALLRSRFADTILKACEKTIGQRDPEKLQREREELDRQQRKDRARLQAEAKAVEEARKRAEAEAAAEAKRKRELEREAARQALMKIEKTVEIDGNSLILEDLELLRSVPGEHAPSSVDETSPDHLQDCMGVFGLGGSNTLEQLGLFMKVDDDEEEDIEATSVPTNDFEEGEID